MKSPTSSKTATHRTKSVIPLDWFQGVGAWHFESNNSGRYIFFDAPTAHAQGLVDVVKSLPLGYRSWGASTGTSSDGRRYEWQIRLATVGKLKDVKRVVEGMMVKPEEPQYPDLNSPAITSSALRQVATQAQSKHNALDLKAVLSRLEAFDRPPRLCRGYLAWRLSEILTRPGHSASESANQTFDEIALLVDQDKSLIKELTRSYGDFLEYPTTARQAIESEFRKIDLNASWASPTDALRRSRASLSFLRKAVILTFGSQDYNTLLLPMLAQVQPPLVSRYVNLPGHVVASMGYLRRIIYLVDLLFAGIEDDRGEPYASGLSELKALRDGSFDFMMEGNLESHAVPPFNAQQLPFVVLPPGGRIEPFITNLRRSGQFHGGEIDPRRLDVLAELWSHLSESGTCTLYDGAFPANGRDNGYLVLVVAYPQYGEDAVAISPWKGEHATFVIRADVGTERSWRSLLTKTKDEAKGLGARRLVFKSRPDYGIDEYEAMFLKVIALFTCEPEQFEGGHLYFDDSCGRYEVRGS